MTDKMGSKNNAPKILVFGKNGQVAHELRKSLPPLGKVAALGSAECDLYDKNAIIQALDTFTPDIVVNAAGYTAVDKAESEREKAFALNADAPAFIADWAAKHSALLVHYSTDYVFDGTKRTPITEDDAPNPLNVYGESKLKGDINIQSSGCTYLIFRTTWVYGTRGKNFYLTMRRLLAEKEKLTVINDQIGAPTWCGTIAEATASALHHILRSHSADAAKELSGIYNLTNSGQTTWFGFARAIKEQMLTQNPNAKLAEIAPILSEQYPTAAARPKFSVLSHTKIEKTFGIITDDWLNVMKSL